MSVDEPLDEELEMECQYEAYDKAERTVDRFEPKKPDEGFV